MAQIMTSSYFELAPFILSWSRTCPELKSKYPEYADNSQGIEGWLELRGAEDGSAAKYMVPGTAWKYTCRYGFDLPPDGTGNPEQVLACQGSRKVDLSGITKICRRKILIQK